MSVQPYQLVRLLQGAAFVALCFFSTSTFAAAFCYEYRGEAENACWNTGDCSILNPNTTFSGCPAGWPHGTVAFTRYLGKHGTHSFFGMNSFPFFSPDLTEPGDYDSSNCFVAYGTQYCPGDENWYDSDGYDDDGCVNGTCPGDPGWTDAEGYNEDGFDSNGLDRGGLTEGEGGGYWGGAGTGGSPPPYIEEPNPLDPQNGNNRDGNNILRCPFAYPITVEKALLPSAVQDGLAGCANECAYQPQSTFFNFDSENEVVQLVPTGFACTTEPTMSIVEITTYTPPPVGEEPADPLDNLNDCYVNGAYLFCDNPTNHTDAPECYIYTAGWIGGAVSCQDINLDPDPQTCGVFNGVYYCLDPTHNCQSFTGTIQCVDDNGNIIDQDSPDHIVNGGNGDGDPNNDVFTDVTDVQNNGQSVQARQLESLNAREFARNIASELAPSFQGLENSIGNLSIDLGYLDDGSQSDGETALTTLTGSIGAVGTDSDLSFDGSIVDNISTSLNGILPSASACTVFDFDIFPAYSMVISIDTCHLNVFRLIAEWALYVMTAIALFLIVVNKKQET